MPGWSPYHWCTCTKNAAKLAGARISRPGGPTSTPVDSTASVLITLGSSRIGGATSSGRSRPLSSSAARYEATQAALSTARLTRGASERISARNVVRNAAACGVSTNSAAASKLALVWLSSKMALRNCCALVVCWSTNSARVNGVAAAITLKRNGMNKISHLPGTGALGLLKIFISSFSMSSSGFSDDRPLASSLASRAEVGRASRRARKKAWKSRSASARMPG